MKVLIVDDNTDFAFSLNKNSGEFTNTITCCNSALSIAEEIIKKFDEGSIDGERYLPFININLLIRREKRQYNKGIEILKWLRLKGKNNHCVLYSFLSYTSIVKHDPTCSILLSRGVTFLQLPFEFPDINDQCFNEVAERENLLPFFRGEVDLKRIRHELANQYGLNKIIECHKLVSPAFSTTISLNSYNYVLSSFIFGESAITKVEPGKIAKIKKRVEEIKQSKPRIIYLDDKADTGWSKLLMDMLGSNLMKIEFEKTDDEHAIFGKYLKFQDNRNVDLFICDLKLKDNEESLTNYTELMSYKIVQKVRKMNPKQNILYLTATNDLNKYKSILKKKSYNPQLIFTKEGIDQMYSEEQSFNNYLELVDSLYLLLKSESAVKKIHNLQFSDTIQAQELIRLEVEIQQALIDSSISGSAFDSFEWVIFDTNAFLNVNDSIKIFKHIYNNTQKTILHKSVYAEIKRFANDQKNVNDKPVASMLANFFLKYFDESNFDISEEEMNQNDKVCTNNLMLRKDFADDFLIRIAKEKAKNYDVLFVSNDRAEGFRKNKAEPDGPVPVLKRWIKANNNVSLKVSSTGNFLHSTINIVNYTNKKIPAISKYSLDANKSDKAIASQIAGSIIIDIVEIQDDYVIVSISKSSQKGYVDLLSTNIKGLIINKNYTVLKGIEIKQSKNNRIKILAKESYININANELKISLSKKINI